IQNADLVLWNYLSNDCGLYVGSGITARRVTSDWDQLTLQWGDQPSVTNVGADTEYGAYSPDCAGSMNYEHDLIHSVNGIVQAWAGGEPNYGFQLRAGDESELRNWRRYRSREETSGYPAHGPRLAVDFEPAAPARQETVVIAVPEPLDTIPTDYNAAVALSTRSGTTPDEFNSIDVPDAVLDATLANRSAMADTVGTDRLTPDEAGVPEPDDTSGGDGEDVVAPRILSHKPAAEAVEVPLDAVVRVTFSEAVGLTEVKVQAPDGTAVAGSLANSNNDTVVTFTPDQPLAPGTKYSTEVSWATDTSENTTEPYTWSFRTVDQAAARWTFNEGVGRTAADSSGNGHTASLNETATWIAGKSGNAISNDPSQARIEASQVAAKQGQAIEVADETTASSVTYALPDGKSYRTDITTGPTRTRSGDGKWIPIDTTLRAQGGRFQPKALAEGMVVDISDGGTDPFVKMSADGKSYALRWPTPLPTPTVQGSVATYKDAAGTGADLVVTVLPAGFRHEVVLRERPAKPLELRIGVDDGVSLKQGKGGRLMLTGEKGKTWVSAAQPHAWDASATAQRPRAKKASVAADVVTKGGRTELVLKPDHAFLADSGTVYPVRLESTTQLPITGDVGLWSLDTPDFPASPSSPMTSAGTMTGNEKLRTYLRFPRQPGRRGRRLGTDRPAVGRAVLP
ncbi:Ig-like domain-containing protein, partial [Nonomuraea sp. NPDC055795]